MKSLLMLANILMFIVTGSLLFFDVSNVFVSVFSIIVTLLILLTFKLAHGNILGLGFVFIAYNLLMHFGFGIIYFLISEEPAHDLYASWTLEFLSSSNYSLAIIISALAFEAFTIAWLVGLKKPEAVQQESIEIDEITESRQKYACYVSGILLLLVVLLYFGYLIFTGRLSIDMTYDEYRHYVMQGNSIYSYVLVLYSTGLLYVVSSFDNNKRWFGIVLFAITAIILLLTGNKGEVLYAVLAALGVMGFQRKKLNYKIVALLCVIMFVIIPVVTATRSMGVRNEFSLELASFTDSFLEIGMQIRCLVYSIDGVAHGAYSYMHGYSYLRPVLKILGYIVFPLRNLPDPSVDLSSSNSDFHGYGFTQVAEGYLNFGIFGAILFFVILGFILGRLEFKKMNTLKLSFVGSVLAILINCSRNSFIFVPGQIIIMAIICFATKIISTMNARR